MGDSCVNEPVIDGILLIYLDIGSPGAFYIGGSTQKHMAASKTWAS